MKLKDIVSQLANRINQPHVIEVYLRQIYAKGFVEGTKQKKPWISVEEQLSEENTGVFFTVEWKDSHKGYFTGLYYGNGQWESDHRIFLPNSPLARITHWMPIPKFNE